MIPRRIGLVVGAVLLVLAAVQGLDVHPDVAGGPVDPLAVVVAAGSAALALVDLALLPAAWRGGRRSATGSAVVLLLGILPSLPAFLLPSGVVPPDGVLAATVGALLHTSATTLVLLERSSRLLVAAAGLAAVACYAGGVALLSAVLPAALDRVVQTAVAVAMAFSFHPLVRLLRRTVGRSLYGGRVAPTSTAAELGRRFGSGEGVVTAALEDARAALRLPALDLLPLPAGAPPDPASVDVPTAGDPGLRLRAGLPPGRTRLRRDEREALELVAVPIALLAGQARLTAEVTAARAAAARAREEERTALQADLHDGLGPLLTGAGLRVGAARNLVPVDTTAAVAHLDAVAADLRVATDEVRRVVHRMRPQELDELGLWAALQHRAERSGATVVLPTHPPGALRRRRGGGVPDRGGEPGQRRAACTGHAGRRARALDGRLAAPRGHQHRCRAGPTAGRGRAGIGAEPGRRARRARRGGAGARRLAGARRPAAAPGRRRVSGRRR